MKRKDTTIRKTRIPVCTNCGSAFVYVLIDGKVRCRRCGHTEEVKR